MRRGYGRDWGQRDMPEDARDYGYAGRDYGYGYGRTGAGDDDYRERGYGVPDYGQRELRGGFAGRGPRGYTRADDRIRDDVGDQLTRDPEIDASDVEFDVNDGMVTLRGSVRSRSDKRRAEDIVEGITGVREVRNETQTTARRNDDSWRTSAMTTGAAGGPAGREQAYPRDRGDLRTVAGVFREMSLADRAINELKALGFAREDISFVTKDRGFVTQESGTTKAETKGTATGALLGGLGGGAIGWLLGIGAIAIPGIGPVVAAGALAATIGGAAAGAVAGGLVGALVGAGIPENEAKDYERDVKEGRVLVTVTCVSDEQRDRAKDVLEKFDAEKVNDFRGGLAPAESARPRTAMTAR